MQIQIFYTKQAMLDKLEAIHKKYLEIQKKINAPDVMDDMKTYVKLSKEYKDLEPVIQAYKDYKNVIDNIENAKEVLEKERRRFPQYG